MTKPKTVSEFLRQHLWQILVFGFGWGIAFIALKYEVVGIQHRVMAIEESLAEYPSQEWFELKFLTIEEKIDLNTNRIKTLVGE